MVQALIRLRDGRTVFHEPKTSRGRRQVALPPAAVLGLRHHRERQEAENLLLSGQQEVGHGFVFCRTDGSPMLPDTVSHGFGKAARRAGLNGIRLHDLRHTHASLMLKQGVHRK